MISTPEATIKVMKLPVVMVLRITGFSIKPVIPANAKETIKIINGLLSAPVNAIFIFCRRLLWLVISIRARSVASAPNIRTS